MLRLLLASALCFQVVIAGLNGCIHTVQEGQSLLDVAEMFRRYLPVSTKLCLGCNGRNHCVDPSTHGADFVSLWKANGACEKIGSHTDFWRRVVNLICQIASACLRVPKKVYLKRDRRPNRDPSLGLPRNHHDLVPIKEALPNRAQVPIRISTEANRTERAIETATATEIRQCGIVPRESPALHQST